MIKTITLDEHNKIYKLLSSGGRVIHSIWTSKNLAEENLERLLIAKPDAYILEEEANNNPVVIAYKVWVKLSGEVEETRAIVYDPELETVEMSYRAALNIPSNFPKANYYKKDGDWKCRANASAFSKGWIDCMISYIHVDADRAIEEARALIPAQIEELENLPELECKNCKANEYKDIKKYERPEAYIYTLESPDKEQYVWFCSDECFRRYQEKVRRAKSKKKDQEYQSRYDKIYNDIKRFSKMNININHVDYSPYLMNFDQQSSSDQIKYELDREMMETFRTVMEDLTWQEIQREESDD